MLFLKTATLALPTCGILRIRKLLTLSPEAGVLLATFPSEVVDFCLGIVKGNISYLFSCGFKLLLTLSERSGKWAGFHVPHREDLSFSSAPTPLP